MNNTDWWRGAVLYQIYPRSFKDSNGDGIGDLPGITEKLDYIASLGVSGIWISPFYKSPMVDFGYDIEDYCAIDPMFGTMEDFDALLDGMHARGLKLVIDLVLNHTSDKHPWFLESRKDRVNPKADWYVWADAKPDGTPPNNWQSVFGGQAWRFCSRRGQYYLHQFLSAQPDLNVRNPEVQDALLGVAKFWLDKGVDGFRLDAVNHCIQDAYLRDNPSRPENERTPDRNFRHTYDMQRHLYDKSQPENLDFLRRLRALVDAYDDRMTVAEIGDDNNIAQCIEYTAPGLLHTAYSFSLLTERYGPDVVQSMVGAFREKGAKSWPSWAFSNHDSKRAATRWAIQSRPDTRQVKMLQALLCSLWGTIFVYQGEELGLTDAKIPYEKMQDPFGKFAWPEDVGRDGCRTPLPWEQAKPNAGFSVAEPWLPVPKEHQDIAVDAQDKDARSPLNFFRSFLKWRARQQALVSGDISFFEPREYVLSFTRNGLIAVFNMGDREADYTLPDGTRPLDGHGLPYALERNKLVLPAFGGFFGEPG
ncbi:MAG: alpha-glucosidase [Alphaproteobacteria bacterium]|nr:alpha-glucosidase [Alphaproteobacteria bacterium]